MDSMYEPSPVSAAGMDSMTSAPPASNAVIFPFNLELGRQLISAGDGAMMSGGHQSGPPMARYNDSMPSAAGPGGPTVDLNEDQLTKLQLDVSDYVDSIDRTLRDMTALPNAKLSRRMRETADIPLTFLYFRTQQTMMKLTGTLNIQEERRLLQKLSSLLDG